MDRNDEKLAMNFWGRVEIKQRELHTNLKEICAKHGLQYYTMLNQKSSAHLPNLSNACILAKELGCSVEWLLYGNGDMKKVESAAMLAQKLYQDKRLFSVAQHLCSSSQEELYALEVMLKIRR